MLRKMINQAMDKWLILDRDGVINYDSDAFIKSADEWYPLPGSLESIAALNAAGYRIVVISNQSGLARGLFDQDALNTIHKKFKQLLEQKGGQIEHIYFCPHGPDDHCACRKPLPGLFKQFAKDFGVKLEGIYALGDSVRDLEAAHSAGASSVLLRTGKGRQSVKSLRALSDDNPLRHVPIYNDLASFTEALLNQ
jgi:D-glycero-D-manno-heptose 1,7-bisphosphate phosphatase